MATATAATTETVTTETVPENTLFADTINRFAYNPATDEGRGFLPLVVRSVGHLLYLVGRYDDTAKSKPTTARAKEEIDGALAHWGNIVIDNSFSTKAKEDIGIISDSLRIASDQIINWSDKDALANTQKLVNRMVQLMANLDREVLGIRDSDAGFNL